MSKGQIDLSDIDETFEEMDKILSIFQQKGNSVTEKDFQSSNIQNKFLKLDFPNGPQTPLAPAPNIAIALIKSPLTDKQLSTVGLINEQLKFQQPIRGSWKNLGSFTTTPFARPIDGPQAKPRNHLGLDMGAPGGTPIYPIAEGIVGQITYEKDPDNQNTLGGTSVWIKHYGGKISSYYAHMDNILVRTGQNVTLDNQIGTCGQSGNARKSVPHLHLGVTINGQWVDPGSFIGNSPSSQILIKSNSIYKLLKLANKIINDNNWEKT